MLLVEMNEHVCKYVHILRLCGRLSVCICVCSASPLWVVMHDDYICIAGVKGASEAPGVACQSPLSGRWAKSK